MAAGVDKQLEVIYWQGDFFRFRTGFHSTPLFNRYPRFKLSILSQCCYAGPHDKTAMLRFVGRSTNKWPTYTVTGCKFKAGRGGPKAGKKNR